MNLLIILMSCFTKNKPSPIVRDEDQQIDCLLANIRGDYL